MPHHWPEDTDFALLELDVIDRNCPVCGRLMYICDHRHRHFFTLDGPVHLVSKLNHCPTHAARGMPGLRGYPVIFPCNSRYLNGFGFFDMSGFNNLSLR